MSDSEANCLIAGTLMGVILGVIFGAMLMISFIVAGGMNYTGVQTIHVVDKYPYGSGTFSIVTCDQVYYVSNPLIFSKIVENGTYKVKFSENPMTHYSMIEDVISGNTVPSGCS